MLIGIDGNEANIKERVGVNVWAFEMIKHLEGLRAKGQGIRADTKFVIYLSRPPLEDLPRETEYWKYRVIGPGKFWTRWRLPLDLYLHKPRPGVFLSLSHYAPKWVPVPRIVCIMDLSFLKYPEAFKPQVRWQLTNWTRESVKNAAHVITISEFNKREIVKNYKYPEDRITVIYPGVSEMFKGPALLQQQGRALSKYGIKGKYLLFVGTRQPKKNLDRLIQAFGLVRKKFPGIQLLVVGKTWPQFADLKFAKHSSWREVSQTSQISSGVQYLGFVTEKDLPGLYAGAEALVLPSLYEGFGIPAAEAMSIGVPVLASNTTSLPEVIGDAGILFNPLDVNDMADKIELVLSLDEKRKRELIKKGMIRARRFSWNIAVDKIIEVLYER